MSSFALGSLFLGSHLPSSYRRQNFAATLVTSHMFCFLAVLTKSAQILTLKIFQLGKLNEKLANACSKIYLVTKTRTFYSPEKRFGLSFQIWSICVTKNADCYYSDVKIFGHLIRPKILMSEIVVVRNIQGRQSRNCARMCENSQLWVLLAPCNRSQTSATLGILFLKP